MQADKPNHRSAVALRISGLSKRFKHFQALDKVSLEVKPGELVCLLGPSGCGKTTLLRCLAGLESQHQGHIYCDGRDISLLPPQERDYGILFQSYALFPHLTAAQNVAYGLNDWSRQETATRVAEMLSMVGLGGREKHYPAQLSGGQQQRVALARALAPAPSLLLLDEPMSALDARVRQRLCGELKALQRRLGITTVMVTHNQQEAMLMADRIAVMNQGSIEQLDRPEVIYREPASAFVADFIGQGNWLPFRRTSADRTLVGGREIQVEHSDKRASGRLFCRPEAVRLGREAGSINNFDANVRDITFLGSRCLLRFELDGLPGRSLAAEIDAADMDYVKQGRVRVSLPANQLKVFA